LTISPTPLLSYNYAKTFKNRLAKITPIKATIYKTISIFNFGLSIFILATPIPTKYPTVEESAGASYIIPPRKEPKNIKKTIRETRIVLRERSKPSNPKFLK